MYVKQILGLRQLWAVLRIQFPFLILAGKPGRNVVLPVPVGRLDLTNGFDHSKSRGVRALVLCTWDDRLPDRIVCRDLHPVSEWTVWCTSIDMGVVLRSKLSSTPTRVVEPHTEPVENALPRGRIPYVVHPFPSELIAGLLRRSERCRIGCRLGPATVRSSLTDREICEREKEQTCHHCDVDGEGLPCIPSAEVPCQPINSSILSVIAL